MQWVSGQKAQVIRRWIGSVLEKIIYYKAKHQRILAEAAITLQHDMHRDILTNNILPFLGLPPLYSFESGDHYDEDDEALWGEDDEEDSYDEEGGDSMSWEDDDEEGADY